MAGLIAVLVLIVVIVFVAAIIEPLVKRRGMRM